MKLDKSREKLAIGLIVFAAFILRIVFLAGCSTKVFFRVPVLDSREYLGISGELAANGFVPSQPFFLSPLYPYFLAVLSFVDGGIAWVWNVQAVLGAATVFLIYLSARRLYGFNAAAYAGILAAFYGPLIFYSAAILPTSLLAFIHSIFIYFLVRAVQTGRLLDFLVAGFVMGAAAVARANVLLVLPAFAFFFGRVGGWRRGFKYFLAGLFLALIPLFGANLFMGSHTPFTANAGYNLFIGNNPGSNGLFVPMSELLNSSGGSLNVAGGSFKPSSRIIGAGNDDMLWIGKVWGFVSGDPIGFVKLAGRKTLLFFDSYEIPQIYNYGVYTRDSFIRVLPSFSFVGPLGLFGLIVGLWRKKGFFVGVYAVFFSISVIAFFVTSRYRIPVIPAFIIFAGYALSIVLGWFSKRVPPLQVLLLFICFFLVNNPFIEVGKSSRNLLNPYNNIGRELDLSGNLGQATLYYKKAVGYNPWDPALYVNLADAYNRVGDYELALSVLGGVEEVMGDSPNYHNIAGLSFFNVGDFGSALTHFQRAVELNPFYVEAWVNLGTVYLSQGDYAGAVKAYNSALEISDSLPFAHYYLGVAYARQGYLSESYSHLDRACELDASLKPEVEGLKREVSAGISIGGVEIDGKTPVKAG